MIKKTEHQELLLFTCRCGSIQHQVSLFFWDWEGKEKEAFLTWQISPVSFWRRVYNALRYIFKGSIYLQEVSLDEKDLKQLRRGITKFLNA